MEIMNGGNHSGLERKRSLRVTHREGLALLAALELAPFEDEILTQKLLDLVYSQEITRHRERHPRHRDFNHQRRRAV